MSLLLTIDAGNTNTVLGVFEGTSLRAHWRLTTRREQTADEYGIFVRSLFGSSGLDPAQVDGVVLASVVPPLTSVLVNLARQFLGREPVVVEPGVKTGMPVLYEPPGDVGADRIVNGIAAFETYGGPVVVVDFGTATTFDCITGDGRFIGGVIMPGLRTASDALVSRTAKLPATELVAPDHVIGRRTDDCIRAGVLLGTAEAVDGLVRRIKAEWPNRVIPKVIATGGLAGLVVPLTREIESTHPELTLTGLRLAARALGLGW